MGVMKVVVLAAGYGTRLEKDLMNHLDSYSQLLGLPKALLPVGGIPLLSHWIHVFKQQEAIDYIYVGVSCLLMHLLLLILFYLLLKFSINLFYINNLNLSYHFLYWLLYSFLLLFQV